MGASDGGRRQRARRFAASSPVIERGEFGGAYPHAALVGAILVRMVASLPNAKACAIIVAAGASSRMGAAGDKTLADLAGEPLIARTVDAFERCEAVSCVALVVSERNRHAVTALGEAKGWRKTLPPVIGGARRQDSVRAGLKELPEDCGWIVVHDGARPFVTPALIEAGLEAAHPTGAAVAVVPAFDTVKRVAPDGSVAETLDRAELRMAQTPQVFRRDVLERAHAEVADDATDDAAMAESVGVEVRTFAGDRGNIKITTAEDLGVGETSIIYAEIRGAYKMTAQHQYVLSVIDRGLDQLYGMYRILPPNLPVEYSEDLKGYGYATEQLWRILLANRIFRSLRSARIIAVHCYYEQAFILCRTAIEHILVAHDIKSRETLQKLNKQERFTSRDFIAIGQRNKEKPFLEALFLRWHRLLNGFVHPSHTVTQLTPIEGEEDSARHAPTFPDYNSVLAQGLLDCLAYLIQTSLPIFTEVVLPYEHVETVKIQEIIRSLHEVQEILRNPASSP